MKTLLSVSRKLDAKLKDSDLEIQAYIVALQKKILAFEVKDVRLNNRINILESGNKKRAQSKLDLKKLSKEEIIQLSELLKKANPNMLSSHNTKPSTKE